MTKLLYLAGPNTQPDNWRTYIKEHHAGETLDPIGREDETVELDKADIETCDVLLANCPTPTHDTAMKILHAWLAYKPVVVIHPADKPVSPWVRYHATAVVHTLDDALKAVTT